MTRSERQRGSAIWSTPQVAQRLRVSEATVKRWTDEGLIVCFRTPGGHRKFRPADVKAFAASHHFVTTEASEPRATDRDDALELALRGDAARLFDLCQRKLEGGLPLERLLDEVLGSALSEVGERWACESLSVAEEHIATTAVGDVLARLAPVESQRPTRGLAICACAEGERHDIATRMAGLVLAQRRFRVLVPASDTPVKSLVRLIGAQRPGIVALSASVIMAGGESLMLQLNEVEAAVRQVGGRLLVGGRGVTDALSLPADVQKVANMRALAAVLPAL
jgi:excisionase family DNA binding protein